MAPILMTLLRMPTPYMLDHSMGPSVRRSVLFAVVFAGLVFAGCDTQERQSEFAEAASLPASGFARTDADGIILDDDLDDWRTAPVYGGKVRFDPAFPNPAAGGFVTLPLTIMEFNAVQGGLVLRARDANGNLRTLDDLPQTADPGVYVFTFAPTILARTGLVRVFVFDRLGEIVSYGDVQM